MECLESFIVIFDNSSPKGFSGQKMKKSIKPLLFADFWFLQSAALNWNNTKFKTNIDTMHELIWTIGCLDTWDNFRTIAAVCQFWI